MRIGTVVIGLTLAGAAPVAAGFSSLSPDMQSSVSAALGHDQAGYRAARHANGFTARNDGQELSSAFTRAGLEVRSHGSRFRLHLRAYGYGGALQPAGEAVPCAETNRIEYRRGPLTEWYVNGPLGLEQGFTLAQPPGSREHRGVLIIALAVSGDLTAAVDPGKTSLTLTGHSGQSELRYTGLTAFDATGRELPASLELRGARLRLEVDDTHARYPVVIDPFVQAAKLTASDGQMDDSLGYSVAVSGNTAVVGAPFANVNGVSDAGAVYVFVQPAAGWGNMTETAKLTASDAQAEGISFLGLSVSIDGNTIVAGAMHQTIGQNAQQGAAYVFVEPAGGWTDVAETAKLTAADGGSYDRFGSGAAISGDTIVVGACQATIGSNPNQGAAYVFVKPAGGWVTTAAYQAKLTAGDATANSFLGISTAIDGDTVVIGSVAGAGAAYVYIMPPDGWTNTTETAKLTAADGVEGDELGYAVAINGGVIAAGAPLATVGTNVEQGAAYVFVEPVSGWASTTQTSKLTAVQGDARDNLGWSIATNGDAVVAGAPGRPGGRGRGRAYLFAKPPTGWPANSTPAARLTAADGVEGNSLGVAVAIGGDNVLVTAPAAKVNSNVDQGAAYVFAP
ncbi:MAG TPA: FG-GAP repeat protein [Bryobacteraceae bacterium]|jgi:hypothetical protein|nr:FG-GAP repeat protein [Bryobacteraceae bacterium]